MATGFVVHEVQHVKSLEIFFFMVQRIISQKKTISAACMECKTASIKT